MKILNLNKNYNKYTSVLPYYVIKAELFNQLPKTLKIINNSKQFQSPYIFHNY